MGHERAARAVESALRSLDPSCDPIVRDATDYAWLPVRRLYAAIYNHFVDRIPRVWALFYHGSERIPAQSLRQRIRSSLVAATCRGFAEAAMRHGADAILCTQFLPAEVYAYLRERGFPIPVSCAITDFSIHPIWVYRAIDRYYVATEQSRDQLLATGAVAADRVEVTGVPIDPKFAESVGKEAARRELGLDPDPERLTLVLMGGGFGWGPMEGMLDVVLSLPDRVQALVIAGRNEALRRRLEQRAAGAQGRIRIHGFTDRVYRFFEAADLLAGKAGGLTSSEAMAKGLPILAVRPIPGQEERNCDYLQQQGAGLRVHDLAELHFRLTHFLNHPEDLARMKVNARAIGKPRSAFLVAGSILSRLTPQPPGVSIR